jgi:putative transposase
MATTLGTQLVLDALNMAVLTRRRRGVIHHSDQGSQGRFKWSSQRLMRSYDDQMEASLRSFR